MKDNKAQSGNVIFYILIAVALLAALSFTVAGSLRGGTGQITGEKAALEATALIEYGNVVSGAVAQLRLRGYQDTEISFDQPVVSGYTNAACASGACKVFELAGAGVTYQPPKADWLEAAQAGQARFGEVYITGSTAALGAGTSADDLVMLIPYVKQEICAAVNKKLGILPPSSVTPAETNGPAAMNAKFTGVYDTVADTAIAGSATPGNATILMAKMAGCTEGSGGGGNPPAGTYHFYQVLLAR